MKFEIIPMKSGGRMIRIGLGQHEGTWFGRLDMWFFGVRISTNDSQKA